MKKLRTALFVLCMAGIICGCGALTDADTTSVIIDKNGAVMQVIVEDFSQPYYSTDELQSKIEQKAAQYNTSSGSEEAVALDSLEILAQGTVKVKVKFAGSRDYTGFNEKLLFVGTVSEAYNDGYTFPDMAAAEGGINLTAADILEKGDRHIVILEEAQQVKTPGKIVYYSDGVSVVDEKTAANLNDGQTAYIIYE